ncbi:hypothetical protein EUGRSUZ_C00656 [Eucalyptus grandis]|uniref:Uncharacterized protein n=2 Tax=Eucalyptus grandis TaxID=71139 RepID=A0ACC3LA77_EUCGR|nr:hypothetical protein EUGRSUZ_C00656 [Eucalyptus grandis]
MTFDFQMKEKIEWPMSRPNLFFLFFSGLGGSCSWRSWGPGPMNEGPFGPSLELLLFQVIFMYKLHS